VAAIAHELKKGALARVRATRQVRCAGATVSSGGASQDSMWSRQEGEGWGGEDECRDTPVNPCHHKTATEVVTEEVAEYVVELVDWNSFYDITIDEEEAGSGSSGVIAKVYGARDEADDDGVPRPLQVSPVTVCNCWCQ